MGVTTNFAFTMTIVGLLLFDRGMIQTTGLRYTSILKLR